MNYIKNVLYFNDEIWHHGIKGQKWGVQNGPPYPLEEGDHSASERKAGWHSSLNGNNSDSSKKGLTQKQKKIVKNVLIASAVVGVTAATVYAYKKGNFDLTYFMNSIKDTKIQDLETWQLDDSDLEFDVGQEFHRISSRLSEDYSLDDKIYVSYKPEDVVRYKAKMGEFFKSWKQNGVDIDPSHMYDLTLKAVNKIKSPSERLRVETFIKLFDNKEFRDEYSKLLGCDSFKYIEQQLSRNGESVDKYAKKMYKAFAGALNVDGDISLAPKIYFDKIRSMGYNAIVDDNDAGKLSETPIILLDPNNNIVKAGSREVGKMEQMLSVFRLKPTNLGSAGLR